MRITDDKNNDLLDIWNSQPSAEINVDEVKKQAFKQKRKQRVYAVIDVLSLSPFLVFFALYEQFTFSMQLFIIVVFLVSIISVIYFIKLRWISMFGLSKSTQTYSAVLLKQLRNNEKIAKINKHFAWIATILVVAAHLITGLIGEVDMNIAIERAKFSFPILVITLIPWFMWSRRRQERFAMEAMELESLIKNKNNL